MQKPYLITGFEPFEGRTKNASWIAADAVSHPAFRSLLLPVVWGEPGRQLEPVVGKNPPIIVIALGEGRPGWFDLEHMALNKRGAKADNTGRLPGNECIEPGGPPARHLSTEVMPLQHRLLQHGYPIRRSHDAGQYLCEETLYTLERLREQHHEIRMALFCHLPPYGTRVTVGSTVETVDAGLLSRFANHLANTCIELQSSVISQ